MQIPRLPAWGCFGIPILSLLAAQEPETTFRADVNLVALDVAVTRQGMPVKGLEQSAFAVTVDGYRAPIAVFDPLSAPLSVVAVFDQSRSMGPSWLPLVYAARSLTAMLRPVDELAVITFNEQERIQLPFTPADGNLANRVEVALRGVMPDGQTALHDALLAATELAGKGSRERRVIVLVSDGADSASSASTKTLFETLRGRNVSVYSLGLFGPDERGSNAGLLKALAAATGGEAVFEPDVAKLRQRVESLFETLRSRYFLAVAIPVPTGGKAQTKRIRVTAVDSTGKHLKTQHRHEFVIQPQEGGN